MNSSIRFLHLIRQDLNLLVLFATLAETRSVTLAAQRLALSQPAVSHALTRLRQLLDDPLFIRGRNGFVLTPRAEALVAPVGEVLMRIEQILAPPRFDPASSPRLFRLSISDYTMATVLPQVVRRLREQAPQVRLALSGPTPQLLAQLENGELDLTFWGLAPPPAAPFRCQELFRERFVGVAHKRHPLLSAACIGLADYLRFPHIEVDFLKTESNLVDIALARQGRKRDILMHTPSFIGNLAAMPGTDLLMSVPSRFTLHFADLLALFDLQVFELPLALEDYSYSIVWHQRADNDPAQRWLRALISDCCR